MKKWMVPDAGAVSVALYDPEPPVWPGLKLPWLPADVPQCTFVCVTEVAPEMLHDMV